MPRIGVVGSLVWDIIHGRDPSQGPVEEWGGIAYALAGMDAALPPDWEIVPLIKVGSDMAPQAREFMGSLRRLTPGGRCVEVPVANNRVVLHYQSSERRCERMAGGVPGWNWAELGPMVKDLDAVYVNFISGFEMCLGTAGHLRRGFAGPILADLHSLFLGMSQDGIRVLQPLAAPEQWFSCFDVVQMNEEEMLQLSADPLALAARALTYGEPIEYSGPIFKSMTTKSDRAVISFNHTGTGLRETAGEFKGFTLAGADGKFLPARAMIDGSTVVVTSETISKPVAVRYGWAMMADGNLFNRDGLPATPFRTGPPADDSPE